ncbi:hypothetical protein Tco_0101821, partial [Tanacetum coccineum]
MNYQPVRLENQANKHAGPQEANQNACTKDMFDACDFEKEAESAKDFFVLPIWYSYSSTVKRSTTKDAGEAPNKHHVLKTDEKPVDKEDQDLLLQEGPAKSSSTNIVNTASTPVTTASPYGGLLIRSGYHQKNRKPSQNDETEHGMKKTVQNQGQSPKIPKSESIQIESAVKPEPELKNTVGCNLNPSDGPGKLIRLIQYIYKILGKSKLFTLDQ